MLNKYLILNYDKLKDMAYNITSGKNHDLLSFVIEELYRCDQERINEIIEKKQMTFYVARIMVNQYYSKTSRFYYKYKKYYKHHLVGIKDGVSDNTTQEIERKEEIEQKLDFIDEKLKDIYWFDAEIFKIYYRDSHSLNSLSKATKISRATIYKSINKVKDYLKNEK